MFKLTAVAVGVLLLFLTVMAQQSTKLLKSGTSQDEIQKEIDSLGKECGELKGIVRNALEVKKSLENMLKDPKAGEMSRKEKQLLGKLIKFYGDVIIISKERIDLCKSMIEVWEKMKMEIEALGETKGRFDEIKGHLGEIEDYWRETEK